jgi:antitoxin (DNA-binding transcriptional repressor) of toxin-antitoxin stability system
LSCLAVRLLHIIGMFLEAKMRIYVKDAENQLPRLLDLAQRELEVVLTADGKPSTQLVPISRSPPPPGERMAVFQWARESAKNRPSPFDVDAARSQDFLYDDDGLPA